MKILIYDTGLGALPFIKEIIKQKKYHDYYILMDEDVFPIGIKSKRYIINRLSSIIDLCNGKYDILVLACNSVSSYLKYIKKPLDLKIISIFELNKKLLDKETTFIATKATLKNVKTINKVDGSMLPQLIESKDLKSIIKIIKEMKFKTKRVVLGCTHFPLIKFIFNFYHREIKFESMENKLVSLIPNGNDLKITGNSKFNNYKKLIYKNSNIFSSS